MPEKPPTLNYKYAIFPTKPQQRHLSTQMKECRFQWNRAVKMRKRLKGSLQCFKLTPVLREILSIEKENTGPRPKAIARLQASFPDTEAQKLPRLYDLIKIFGKDFTVKPEHSDLERLTDERCPADRGTGGASPGAFIAAARCPGFDRGGCPGRGVAVAVGAVFCICSRSVGHWSACGSSSALPCSRIREQGNAAGGCVFRRGVGCALSMRII